jgi:uncharacterized protein (DUF58 family)
MQKRNKIFRVDVVHSLVRGEFQGLRSGGGGIEIDHVRPWQPGDLLKSTHRRATKRHGKRMVTARTPDRELGVVFAVDMSKSMQFGSTITRGKENLALEIIEEAVSVLRDYQPLFSLANSNLEDEMHDLYLGVGSVDRKKMYEAFTQSRNEEMPFKLDLILRFLSKEKRRSCLIIILSDFLIPANYEDELRCLKSQGHKVVALFIQDPIEESQMQGMCAFRVQDSETGETGVVNSSSLYCTKIHKEMFVRQNCPHECVTAQVTHKGGSS